MKSIRDAIRLFFNNDFNGQTAGKFGRWLVKPDSEAEKTAALEELWNETRAETPAEDLDRSFASVAGKIETYAVRPPRKPLWRRVSAAAAIAALPLLTFGITYYYFSGRAAVQEVEFTELFVPRGEVMTVTLPDASEVVLNSASVIIYPSEFSGSKREVFINGEALLTVTKDPKRPFIVKTADMDVRVLGTVFGISSYPEDKTSSTTLVEGKVAVKVRDSEIAETVLRPGQQLEFDRTDRTAKVTAADMQYLTSWIEGNLVMQEMDIQEIIMLLERRFGVAVYLNSSRYDGVRITAKLMNGEDLNDMLLVLTEIIPGFRYSLSGEKLYIY